MTNIYIQGAVVAVIGIATVFVVLAILWGTLELMRVAFTRGVKPEKKADPAPMPAQVVAEPAASVVAAAEDEELIAVLTAAVAVCLGQPAGRLQIKSYRRIESGAPVWNRTARRDNLIG